MIGSMCVAWWWCWLVIPAIAADTVALPASESVEEWRIPLQLAELVPGDDSASLRIVATRDGVWFIESAGSDGQVRRVRVQPPRNRRDREEIAFLARSIARESAAAPTPLAHQAPRLPPPPPPPDAGVSTPADPPASDSPHAELDQLVPPRSELVISRERKASERSPAVEELEYWSAGGNTGVAAIELRAGYSVREGTDPTAVISMGLPLYTRRFSTVRLAWGGHVSRGLRMGFQRRMVSADLELEAALRPLTWLEIGGFTGISYRTFRQQNQPILRGVVPVAGPRLLVVALPGRRFAIDLWTDLSFDLGRFQLEREDGSQVYLSPIELNVGARFRFRGSGDLYDGIRTPRKQ